MFVRDDILVQGTEPGESRMFRQPNFKRPKATTLSTRVYKPMADDTLREARRRKTLVSVEVRRRLELYANHKHLLEAPAADQQPNTAA